MNNSDSQNWKLAIKEELQALEANNTWELKELPPNKTAIGCKWVFKIKNNPTTKEVRYKARLCAKGCSQVEGLDYNETYAPTTRYDTIRILLAIAIQQNLDIIQFDVKTAFLHGELEEEIYMTSPEGYVPGNNLVCKLQKSLYGLKQSPRCWNKKFNEFLKSYNFKQCNVDKCVYTGKLNNNDVIIVLYVDDGLIMTTDLNTLEDFIGNFKRMFKITLSDPTYFVGLEILRKENSLFIHVSTYIQSVLNKFKCSDVKPCSTPVDLNVILDKDID